MARWPTFLPENDSGALVEVTSRTIGAQALLLPAPDPRRFNEIVLGVMGRALEVSPLELCGAVFLANHFHLLAVVHEQQDLSRFMHHLAGNLSKEVGRIRQRTGPMWARRYDGIVVSHEPAAQWSRLKYLLSHSVKEGLCESPFDWPGVHCAKALVHGEKLEGVWFNRSKEWAARNRGLNAGYYDFATRYEVGFAPLPAFRDLSEAEYRVKVAELVREIEAEGIRARDGDPVAGVEKILSQNPYHPPTRRPKKSPKPLFHVRSREARDELCDELKDFLAQYLEASDALRSGRRVPAEASLFPVGCYPPALAFTGSPAPRRPPAPPTRRLRFEERKVVQRGPIPVVALPVRVWLVEPRARGHPP
jgi:hypothetical protein